MSKPKLEGVWAKLERAKYHLEQLRLELSRHQHSEGAAFGNDLRARQHVFKYLSSRQRFIRAASIALPLIVGFYASHRQVKTAFEIKQIEAKNSFELKAAELLLN